MSANISFVLPMYNEEKGIENTITRLIGMAGKLGCDYEIVVADDASTDKSAEVVEKIVQNNPRIKLVRLARNTKFGGALRAGLKKASKEIIVYTDSDLPVDFEDIEGALKIIEGVHCVTGSSKVEKGENPKRIIISKVYNFIIQSLFRTNIKDINSGLKIYKREIFCEMKLFSNSPFIDVEIFVNMIRKGFLIKQYPVIFKNRKEGKSYISSPAVILRTFLDMLKFKFRGVR
ncbi:MAG: glycosyltransferase family 2 protein [Candidatus Omnitrophota bacterium]